MTTVYLHIGTMKTGTSALQRFLAGNREVLKKYGYAYPYISTGTGGKYKYRNGHFLVWLSENEDLQRRREEEKNVREAGFRQLRDAVRECDHIILSDEAVWNRMNRDPDRWQEVMRAFESAGCRVKIIVYLRRQDMYAQSYWKQIVKSNIKVTGNFDLWLKDHADDPMFRYHSVLEGIAGHAGKENVIVRVYEQGQFEGGSIFADFLRHIGLDLTDEYDVSPVLENASLEGNFIEFKRYVNGIPEYRMMPDFLNTAFRKASVYGNSRADCPKMSLFSYGDQVEFLERYAEENRRVAQEYLNREDGRLFYDPVEELPKWSFQNEKAVWDLLAVMSEAFCSQEKKIDYLRQRVKELQTDTESMYNSAIFRTYRTVRKRIKNQE